jgi:hypothetical protein
VNKSTNAILCTRNEILISFLNIKKYWNYNFYVNEPHNEHCDIIKKFIATNAKFYYLMKDTMNWSNYRKIAH